MNKRILLKLFLLFLPLFSFSQGYMIKGKIKGLTKVDTCFLVYYYGDNNYIKDTVLVDSKTKNTFTFKGKEKLTPGIFIVLLQDKRWFDIIIDNEQNFSFETDNADLQSNLTFNNSADNTLFYNYVQFLGIQSKKIEPYKAALSTKDTANEAFKTAKNEATKIDKEVQDYKKNLFQNHTNALFVRMLRMMEEPIIPDAPLLSSGIPDSTFAYRYYKGHFFDQLDLTDDRLSHTPSFHTRIKKYINDLTPQHPDSLIVACDFLLKKSISAKENFKWILFWLTDTYEKSNIMGMDKVFVHLSDKYYKTGLAYWVNKETQFKIEDRANQLRNNLLGAIATELFLPDTLNRKISLYKTASTSKLTVVYFWDPTCSHCQKVTPKVVELHNKYRKEGVATYAVSIQNSVEDLPSWKKYIVEHGLNWINTIDVGHTSNFRVNYDIRSSPVIFLINNKKEILAKGISWEQLDEMIEKELKK